MISAAQLIRSNCREWTIQESWLLTPDSLETFLRWESESRVTTQDSRVRSQLKSPSENLENFEHFLLIYLVNEALKCWKWSGYSKRYLNMVKVVNKVKDELEKLPYFTVSYGIKIGSDRESWLELESSNLRQRRESESEYWNKVTRPFPSKSLGSRDANEDGRLLCRSAMQVGFSLSRGLKFWPKRGQIVGILVKL